MGTYLAGYAVPASGFHGLERLTSKQVVYMDNNGHIQELMMTSLTPWQITDLTSVTGAPLGDLDSRAVAGYYWPSAGTKQVVYQDQSNHVRELFAGGNQPWSVADLTSIANAPTQPDPGNGSFVGFAWPPDGTKLVNYIGIGGHIQELVVGQGQRWSSNDLTNLASGGPLLPSAHDGALMGYAWSAGGTKQVVYRDYVNRHIHELFVGPGQPWGAADLTNITGAPPASAGAIAAYDWPAGGTKQVVYIDLNGHIQELVTDRSGNWQAHDLTSLTRAPLASGDAIAGYAWSGGTKQVVYRDYSGHIQELTLSQGQPWSVADLTRIAGAPPAISGVLAAYDWLDVGSKQVVYVDMNGHIHELAVSLGQNWQAIDLTSLTGAAPLKFRSKVLDFRASPADAQGFPEITAGDAATLSWEVESFSAPDIKVSIQAVAADFSYSWRKDGLPLRGTLSVAPSTTSAYNVWCNVPSLGGVADRMELVVGVKPAPSGGGGGTNPPPCTWFYFRLTDPDNSNSCFTDAVCAMDEATAQQVAQAQATNYTIEQVDYSTYLQDCM